MSEDWTTKYGKRRVRRKLRQKMRDGRAHQAQAALRLKEQAAQRLAAAKVKPE